MKPSLFVFGLIISAQISVIKGYCWFKHGNEPRKYFENSSCCRATCSSLSVSCAFISDHVCEQVYKKLLGSKSKLISRSLFRPLSPPLDGPSQSRSRAAASESAGALSYGTRRYRYSSPEAFSAWAFPPAPRCSRSLAPPVALRKHWPAVLVSRNV